MKVYIVCWGDYDGGGTIGVFSTLDEAKEVMKANKDQYYSRFIEEWEVGGPMIREYDNFNENR